MAQFSPELSICQWLPFCVRVCIYLSFSHHFTFHSQKSKQKTTHKLINLKMVPLFDVTIKQHKYYSKNTRGCLCFRIWVIYFVVSFAVSHVLEIIFGSAKRELVEIDNHRILSTRAVICGANRVKKGMASRFIATIWYT